ncbi:MAG: hypothetical protein SV253_04725 [Halobacteria archaeon]|nr:hypothetical protein [Halobacteria archaeon]
MNTSKVMGTVLLLLGVLLAGVVPSISSPVYIAAGFVGVVSLFYMGIGLRSRGFTESGVLRSADEGQKKDAMSTTALYVSGLAAVGSLIGFVGATASGGEIVVKAVFGVVFVYSLSTTVWLRTKTD